MARWKWSMFIAHVLTCTLLGADSTATCSQEGLLSKVAPRRRVVSVGDFHGDWEHAVQSLTSLGFLTDGHWSGGDAVLVQTGDIVDRGDAGKRLWEMMLLLQSEAPQSGGRVILLLGNHELMNMDGDLRYATQADLDTYGGRDAHKEAWSPSGSIGKELREHTQTIALVSDVVYSHAGLMPAVLDMFATNLTGEDAVNAVNAQVSEILLVEKVARQGPSIALLKSGGPFWTRTLSQGPEDLACPLLEETLMRLGARRMVVGHTAQKYGNIALRCGGRFVLADTFMSQAYTKRSEKSMHNEAATEFFGDSLTMHAVYPQRDASQMCASLRLDHLRETGVDAGSDSGVAEVAESTMGGIIPRLTMGALAFAISFAASRVCRSSVDTKVDRKLSD